jgi:hypothetical protein
MMTIAALVGLLVTTSVTGAHASTQEATPEVVGGSAALIADAPWQVALLSSAQTNAYDAQFCGGSLISTQWIITAAHCVYDLVPSQLRIQAGNSALSTTTLGGKSVAEIIVHPDYDYSVLNDIALVRLSAPLTPVANSIAPIPLVSSTPPVGASVLVTGWGATNNAGTSYPTGLRKATLNILADSVCSGTFAEYDSSSSLCAGKSPFTVTAPCFGDSGGPLAYQSGGQWRLAGLVSYGSSAGCISGSPDGFTRVSTFVDWIQSTTLSLAGTVSNALLLPADDGIGDTAVLTITDDKAQTVTLTLDPDSIGASAGSLTLALSAGLYRATTTLSLLTAPFTDLAEGDHVIRATTASESIDIPFTAQTSTGLIFDASATTDATVYYPAKDGYRDTITVTLSTIGSDYTPIAFRAGVVTLYVDDTQMTQCTLGSSTGGIKSCVLTIAAMRPSTAVVISVAYEDSIGTPGYQEITGITFGRSAITAASVTTSKRTIYPVYDGYLDNTQLQVRIPSSISHSIGLVGSKVTIKRGSRTVLTWNLTTSGTHSKTWNGKDGSSVVPGNYTVTVSARGTDGSRYTDSLTIVVSAKSWVSTTLTKTYNAQSAFTGYYSYDYTACTVGSGNLYVYTYWIDETLCFGTINLPSDVRSGLSRGVSVKVGLTVQDNIGDYCGQFLLGGTSLSVHAICGNGTFRWNLGRLDKDITSVMPTIYASYYYTKFTVTKITLTYTYKKLM